METRNYIGGEWQAAAAGAEFEVLNPADESVVARVADSRAADAQRARERIGG